MAVSNPVSKPSQPAAIKEVVIDKNFEDAFEHYKNLHSNDPQFKTDDMIKPETQRFMKRLNCSKVRPQYQSDKIDNDVQEMLDGIGSDSVASNKKRTVWRGLKGIESDLQLGNLRERMILHKNPPASTSINPHIAIGYGTPKGSSEVEMLMKITVPKGIKILMYNLNEMEVLLKHGFWLRIDRIDIDIPLIVEGKKPTIICKMVQATALPARVEPPPGSTGIRR